MNEVKILLAVVLALVANGATTFAINKFSLLDRSAKVEHKAEPAKVFKKTKAINIPVLEEKEVKGYFLIQFAYAILGGGKETAGLEDMAEIYILDEAVTQIYGIGNTFGAKLSKEQLGELAPKILAAVQNKMGNQSVKELLVNDFTYIPRADVR